MTTPSIETKTAHPSDLLRKAMDAGSVVGLFPVLQDWSQADLKQLVTDAEQWAEHMGKIINQIHGQLAFRPATFFSKQMSHALDVEAKKQHEAVFIQCTEIISVALFYIKK